jgi:uncharacterized Tic20 family protein
MESNPSATVPDPAKESEARSWAMFMHLSLYCGKLFPLAGFILPFALWQMKKDTLPKIDAHGKVLMNWILSVLIYATIGTLLSFLCVGIFLLIPLVVAMFIFPIIGALKANSGEVWAYPLSIPFF